MLDFKPRTHSDPDLPQLLPLPVRPHSSYQAKLQFKDQAQFQEKVVHAMAQKLGVDLVKDAELRWVIRDCLLALKEEGWTCVLKGFNDLAYAHCHGRVARFSQHGGDASAVGRALTAA